MLSEDPFLRTILDRPVDDGPRLVFADWLEEQGHCERAELIRLQCCGGDAGRIRDLIEGLGRVWAGAAGRHAYGYAFRRGFVEEITVSARTLREHGPEIFAEAPVRLLRVIGARDLLGDLVRLPLLARVSALHLTGCHCGDEGARLLAGCEHLANLRTLRLGDNAVGDAGVEALADSPVLDSLEVLVLSGNLIHDAGAQALATAGGLSALNSLDLSDNWIGEGGAGALARCRGFAYLTRLDLSNQFKGRAPGLTLRSRPYPIQPQQRAALAARFGADVCVY